jgi:biopolymer transport protein ExbD/biopolymer transport protein TolR
MGVNGEINVVSLIDVMMLLMVIFMITAPIMHGGVDIVLPKADVRPLDAKNGVVISIDRNGQIFVDDTRLSYREFTGSIKALSAKKGGGGVSVSADKRVDWGTVMRVVAAIKAAGITEVGLVGDPETPL